MVRTPHSLRTVRRVALQPDATVSVSDGVEGWFRGEVIPPNEDPAEALEEGAPRERKAYVLQWPAGRIGPGVLAPSRPSERVQSGSLTYETLGLPRKLHTGRREVGVEVAVMPLDVLYPYTAILQEQGGAEVLPEVPVALWDINTDRSDRGQYSTFEAEAPIEFSAQLEKNRQLVINGNTYRIVDPYTPLQIPRVRMTLRGAR